jgi:hypothetical protein
MVIDSGPGSDFPAWRNPSIFAHFALVVSRLDPSVDDGLSLGLFYHGNCFFLVDTIP